jgi:hypothetical protein
VKKPIFIIGLPRSGSTLWHNIIAMNPEICRLAEMHFLNPWHKDFRHFLKKSIKDLSNEQEIKNLIDLIFSPQNIHGIYGAFWRFENIQAVNNPDFKKEITRKIIASDKSLGSIFKIILEEITRFSGYNRFCVKFPVYVNYIPELLTWYPDCKIIHVTRDPRAIAMSKTNDPGGTAITLTKFPWLKYFIRKIKIIFVVIQYIWASKLHLKYSESKNYALFKHEDLLEDPLKAVKELCEFIEIDFDPKMLELDKGRHDHQPSSLTNKKKRNIDRRAALRWTSIITPFEEKMINYLTQSSMKRYNFDPINHPIYRNNIKQNCS